MNLILNGNLVSLKKIFQCLFFCILTGAGTSTKDTRVWLFRTKNWKRWKWQLWNNIDFTVCYVESCKPSQWRYNEHDGISNHRHLNCLLNRMFRRRLKKASKLSVTGLCERNPHVIVGFPSQRASNAENASIWWGHHEWHWSKQVNTDVLQMEMLLKTIK